MPVRKRWLALFGALLSLASSMLSHYVDTGSVGLPNVPASISGE